MLYKFKSQADADLIMLEALGKQVLGIIGKDGAKGILAAEEMPAAIAALKAAIVQSEQVTSGDLEDEKKEKPVSLRARVWPFVLLLERSMKAKVPVTWGV